MTTPPHPRANPVLGSALDLRRSQIRTYERMIREHGDIVGLSVGPPGVRFDLYETTSTALRFTLHLLGRHPSEQRLAHDELDGRIRRGEPVRDARAPAVLGRRRGVRPRALHSRSRARAAFACLFPFGGGPRACIGSHFAMLEAVIAVGVLLQRVPIRSHKEDVPLDTEGVTLWPKGAVPIQPTAR